MDRSPLELIKSLKSQEKSPRTPRGPPPGLREAGRNLWNQVLSEYQFQDAAGRTMLALACQSLDRAERLRARIDADGEVLTNPRTGTMRSHPGIRDEVACRAFTVKTLTTLGLNYEALKTLGRPARDNHWGDDDERD
jgi:hypothetical protein